MEIVISAEAARIRDSLELETVDPAVTPQVERRMWEEAVEGSPIAPGTSEKVVALGGVHCVVIERTNASPSTSIVYLHGGGFTSGSPTTHRQFASRVAAAVGSNVVLVDYRLLPENVFPAPVDDVVAVVKALASSDLRRPRSKILLAGDSSGASLAVAAACELRDAGDSLVHGIISISGAFDATLSGASIDAGCDPQLSRAALDHWKSVISSCVDPTDPLVSPLLGEFRDLPPMLLLAGSCEAWLSDSVRLADRVGQAGGDATLEVFDGMWHVWPMYGDFPESEAALRSIGEFVGKARRPRT